MAQIVEAYLWYFCRFDHFAELFGDSFRVQWRAIRFGEYEAGVFPGRTWSDLLHHLLSSNLMQHPYHFIC